MDMFFTPSLRIVVYAIEQALTVCKTFIKSYAIHPVSTMPRSYIAGTYILAGGEVSANKGAATAGTPVAIEFITKCRCSLAALVNR
jgi:hypothetical protein